jgi:hypothetical protein
VVAAAVAEGGAALVFADEVGCAADWLALEELLAVLPQDASSSAAISTGKYFTRRCSRMEPSDPSGDPHRAFVPPSRADEWTRLTIAVKRLPPPSPSTIRFGPRS